MKKIITLGLITVTMLSVVGCSDTKSDYEGFTLLEDNKTIDGLPIKEVIDKQTGVHYYVNTSTYRSFIAPVYTKDGNVKITSEK